MTVSYEQLQEMSGYKTPAEVCAWLVANKIKYLKGKHGRPATTELAVNTALGVVSGTKKETQARSISV